MEEDLAVLRKFNKLELMGDSTITSSMWLLEYVPEDQNFVVHKFSGKISQTIGHTQKGKYILDIPEGVYLLEQGRAILVNHKDFERNMGRILLVEETKGSIMDRCSAFRSIKNFGYILKDICRPVWTIYSPNSEFKKTCPSLSMGQLVISRMDDLILGSIENESKDTEDFFVIGDSGSFISLRTKWVSLDSKDNFNGHSSG